MSKPCDRKMKWLAHLARRRTCSLLIVLLSGCGGGSSTQALSGTVTVDGQPLKMGEIKFTPFQGTTGPIAGAAIENGLFEVPAVAQGLKTGGTYRVEISSMVGSGEWVASPVGLGGKREALKNIVPARYNIETELQITISADPEENTHDFALTSAPP